MELFLGLSFLAVIGFVVCSAVREFSREECLKNVYYHSRTNTLIIGSILPGVIIYSSDGYPVDLSIKDLNELELIGKL